MECLELMSISNEDHLDVEITIQHPHMPMTLCMKGSLRVVARHPLQHQATGKININRQLQTISGWERAHLPYPTSRIARELFIMLGHGSFHDKPLTVKNIVLTTGYSERAIRQQLRQFETDGWIKRTRGIQDKRNITIESTENLQCIFRQWLDQHAHTSSPVQEEY